MGLLSAFAALAVAVVVYLLWRWRAYEVVDFSDPVQRRSAAARWMASGEGDKAEEMLRAAVVNLEAWPKALAHADLATLLMASERDSEAIAELEAACRLETGATGEQEEMLEIRIRLARLLTRAGRDEDAERVLIEAEAISAEPVISALRKEAMAEFHIDQGESEKVLSILEPVFELLASVEHDRAAAVAVTLAYARQELGASDTWKELDALADDLKSSVVVNFCDRLPTFSKRSRLRLLDALVAQLSPLPEFVRECEQLREVAAAMKEDNKT